RIDESVLVLVGRERRERAQRLRQIELALAELPLVRARAAVAAVPALLPVIRPERERVRADRQVEEEDLLLLEERELLVGGDPEQLAVARDLVLDLAGRVDRALGRGRADGRPALGGVRVGV